ncbi:DUF4123 domain-containing protein [Pseudomonas syringae]|nr:DUF4123 domain-containing protein [Pseudomonas syringae]MCF5069043.1 DUF4123 domain-containing protein [Pseudomonas syringae]
MTLSTALPHDLPWADLQPFLLLDGVTLPNLPAVLAKQDPCARAIALYDFAPFNGLSDISPLLVQLKNPDDPVFRFYLERAHEEWGLLLFSQAATHCVVQHLRKLVTVQMPGGFPVFLRLADAAVAQALFSSGDQRLFGPLSHVVTPDYAATTWHRHQPRHPECPELPIPYRLSDEQCLALDQVDRRRALLDLDAHLLNHFPEHPRGASVAERLPALQKLESAASDLGLDSRFGLFHYANIMARLDGSPLSRHPEINRLLHGPSLQPVDERVVLAADLARDWVNGGRRP